MDENTIKAFTSLIRDIVREEVQILDHTVPCEVISLNEDDTVNVVLISDPEVVINNVQNSSNKTLHPQDIVFLYKI